MTLAARDSLLVGVVAAWFEVTETAWPREVVVIEVGPDVLWRLGKRLDRVKEVGYLG